MFEGILPALVTPFKETSGSCPPVDYQAWDALVEWQLDCGVNGLVIFGTTGESATLDREEKLELAKRTIAIVKGRVPVVAGTGGNCTKTSIEMTKTMAELGCDGALAVAPYYNKPSQEGMYQHFRAIAEEGGLPVVVYNVPGRTITNISVETFSRLAELDNIAAVKQAFDSASTLTELAGAVGGKLDLLAGDDPLTFLLMSVGGKGAISASANVIPKGMLAITENAMAGKWQESFVAQQAVLPVIKVLFSETNPVPAKAALKLMGIIPSDTVRLPLTPASAATREALQRVLDL